MARPRPRLRDRARPSPSEVGRARRTGGRSRPERPLADATSGERRHPGAERGRTLGAVLAALAAQEPAPFEVIVVDDGSTDATAAVAREAGAQVVETGGGRFAGGARNAGWDGRDRRAGRLPRRGRRARRRAGARASARAVAEFPGAIVGCARTLRARDARGAGSRTSRSRRRTCRAASRASVPFVSSFCMLVPRDAPLRWDESYGGEDALFCADALRGRDPARVRPALRRAAHEHERATLRRPAAPAAAARVRPARARPSSTSAAGPPGRSGALPLHYFALLRLPVLYRRLDDGSRAAPPLRRPAAAARARRVDARRQLGAVRGAAAGAARRAAAAVRVTGRPILVTGAHRSGTTWVGKMLALAPGVAYVHEPFNPLHRRRASARRRSSASSRVVTRGERGALPRRASSGRSRSTTRSAPQLRALRTPARRRPDGARRARVRARAAARRAAARQGPDRAPVGGVARGALRDGRRRADPPSGRRSREPEAAAAGRTASATFLQDGRLPELVRPSRPRSASRPSGRASIVEQAALLWRILYAAVDGYRRAAPGLGGRAARGRSRATRSATFEAALRAARARAGRERRASEIERSSAPDNPPEARSKHDVRVASAENLGRWRARPDRRRSSSRCASGRATSGRSSTRDEDW